MLSDPRLILLSNAYSLRICLKPRTDPISGNNERTACSCAHRTSSRRTSPRFAAAGLACIRKRALLVGAMTSHVKGTIEIVVTAAMIWGSPDPPVVRVLLAV